ncbi:MULTISPECIES: hypothetical protein [Spirulina sp. CCY15215]|uniref:hypothetical protein n=1 Tax=Spirulina sp. CCY15215 TaxID=2767591 RepID=UPI00194FBBB9|nr:hypothetical protein [Spirulina major]
MLIWVAKEQKGELQQNLTRINNTPPAPTSGKRDFAKAAPPCIETIANKAKAIGGTEIRAAIRLITIG